MICSLSIRIRPDDGKLAPLVNVIDTSVAEIPEARVFVAAENVAPPAAVVERIGVMSLYPPPWST